MADRFISLAFDWQYHRAQPVLSQQEPMTVGALSAWRAVAPEPGWELRASRPFSLEPMDICVRYRLHLDALPGQVKVILRENVIWEGSEAVMLDVTDEISLDDNQLTLILDLATIAPGGRFGRIWLESVPCEEGD